MAKADEPHKGRQGRKAPRSSVGFGEKSHKPSAHGSRVPAEAGDNAAARSSSPQAASGLRAGSPYRPAGKRATQDGTAPAGAVISRRAADRLRSGHVWVYASEIESLELGDGEEPSLLPVADNRGLLLGAALFSPASQIALRMVSREAIGETQWLELLAARLRVSISRRLPLLVGEERKSDSCRLCFSEADELPGLVIDKYADLIIVQLLARGLNSAAVREAVTRVLTQHEHLFAAAIWERPDPRIRELEGLPAPAPGPLWAASGKEPKAQTQFVLNGRKFFYDANSGQKTGAFLDQQANYAAASEWAKRLGATGRALDVCTYQGGFALHLASVSKSVTGIDASHASLEVAERNLEANRDVIGDKQVDWVEGDAFEILRDWSSAGEQFDAIVLDPPAFAKSKRAVEGALRGYKELNLRAFKMLRPGGLLVSCSCSHHVSWADLERAVAAAATDAGARVRLLERRGAAPDHPVVLNLPETEYLKCLVIEKD